MTGAPRSARISGRVLRFSVRYWSPLPGFVFADTLLGTKATVGGV